MADKGYPSLPDAGENIDNSANWIAAQRAGRTDRDLDLNYNARLRNDATNQQVGNALADKDPEDWTTGRDIAFRAGNIKLGSDIQDAIKKASNEELADHALKNQKLSTAVQEANDFNHIDQVSAAAKLADYNTGQYDPLIAKYRNVPGGLDIVKKAILADTGQYQSYLEGQAKQRAENQKTLGQIALSSKGDDDELAKGLLAAGRSGIPVAHLLTSRQTFGPNDQEAPTQQSYGLAPGARALIEGQGGQGQTVFNADAKAQLAANRATKQSGEDAAVKKMQDEFASQNPDAKPLAYTQALSAHNALTSKFASGSVLKGWKIDGNGNAVEPIWGAPTGTAAELRSRQYDPEAQYNKQFGKKVADVDATQVGREAQAVIVDRHTDLAAGLAGGWEKDASKLTPIQQAQRKSFEDSIGGIKGNIPKIYQTIKGEIAPDSNTPAVVRELTAINQMMKAEATRLATMGQGAVAEGVRHEFDGVIGNFLNSPSVKTYLDTLSFTKKIMGEFKDVPMVGKGAVQKLKDNAPSPGRASPGAGHVEDGYRFKGGDPSKASNWEAVR